MVNGGTLLFHASPLRGERIFGRALARKVEVRRYSTDTPNNPRQAGRSPDEGGYRYFILQNYLEDKPPPFAPHLVSCSKNYRLVSQAENSPEERECAILVGKILTVLKPLLIFNF